MRQILGISIPSEESDKIEQTAASLKLSKGEFGRALLRAGQLMFRENPTLVLTYVPTKRTVD